MKQTLLIILSSFLATAALIKASPALAEPAPASVNVSIVSTADLDLSSGTGRRQLDQRLVSAARDVCGTASDADLAGKNVVRQCRHDVLTKAQAKRDALLASAARSEQITVTASR